MWANQSYIALLQTTKPLQCISKFSLPGVKIMHSLYNLSFLCLGIFLFNLYVANSQISFSNNKKSNFVSSFSQNQNSRCFTVSGPNPGKRCIFPFKFNGKTFNGCDVDPEDR